MNRLLNWIKRPFCKQQYVTREPMPCDHRYIRVIYKDGNPSNARVVCYGCQKDVSDNYTMSSSQGGAHWTIAAKGEPDDQ